MDPEDIVKDEHLQGWEKAHIDGAIHNLVTAIQKLGLTAKVDALNAARRALHEVSPFKSEPVDCVLWFKAEEVEENAWNPNTVPAPEFVALTHSVKSFGYTMPIVGVLTGRSDIRVRITDGKHRNVVGRVDPEIRERLHGYLPLSLLREGLGDAEQMSATILHNKARGQHSITKEMEIVTKLEEEGWDPAAIGVGTVKTNEEIVRINQLAGKGAAENLAGTKFSKGWDFW